MKKLFSKIYFAIIFLIIPVCAFAWGIAIYQAQQNVAAGSCTTSDEACTGTDDGSYTTQYIYYYATKFTSSGTDAICSLTARIDKVGSPDHNIRACIYDNNAVPTPNEPNAVVGTCSDYVTPGSVSTSLSDITFPNINSGALTDATSYWVVLEISEKADNPTAYYEWAYETTSCSVESVFYSTDGSTWTDLNQFRSMEFVTYK